MLYIAGRSNSIAGDNYRPLIDLWILIQCDVDRLVEDYERQWSCLKADGPEYYYKVRQRFNERPNALDLLFLTRTCVNGIIRFNKNGHFNNSYHLSRHGMHPDRFRRVAELWAPVIREMNFVCQDYRETLDYAVAGDFVYLDPPYLNNNSRYFSEIVIDDLFLELEKLNSRGVKWMLSLDGARGGTDLTCSIPMEIYMRKFLLDSGDSAVAKVLEKKRRPVKESVYLNY